VGNGMSLIIFVAILSQFPSVFVNIWGQTWEVGRAARFIVIVAIFLIMIAAIIYVDQGQRRIPIQFAKRVRGRRVMGGQSTYIPLKVNTAGVIPVIFATSVLLIPSLIITAIPSDAAWLQNVYRWIDDNLGAGAQAVSWWYIAILFALIVFFTYFYTAIQFDPEQQSEMIQRQGGFIPGVRPGRQTSRYLAHILNRITLPGSIFLATISILPAIAGAVWNIQIAFSGVSILIVVGVALETMKQIESQLTMRNYEGILT
jgi:preprotein translocase subunit SecY